jgi:hypothetical protein
MLKVRFLINTISAEFDPYKASPKEATNNPVDTNIASGTFALILY